jgi:integrase
MAKGTVVRVLVKPGIYRRTNAAGDIVYEILYRDSDGKQRLQKINGNLKAAEAKLGEIKRDKFSGKRVAPNPRLTFALAAERWLESYKATRRKSSVAVYAASLKVHLIPAFGRRRLDQINVDDMARLIEKMQTVEYRGKVSARKCEHGYSQESIRRALVCANMIFSYSARRLGWAGTNPVGELLREERPAKQEQQEKRIVTREELALILGQLEGDMKTLVLLLAHTGARIGEALGLRWRDINLEAATVSFKYQSDRHEKGKLSELKTKGSKRTIEIPARLVAELRAHKLAARRSGADDLAFVMQSHRAQRHVTRACKRAALAEPFPTLHSFRHSHASALIAEGSDLVEVSTRLGHSSPVITAGAYGHEFEAAQRSDARRARLESIYGQSESAPKLRIVE